MSYKIKLDSSPFHAHLRDIGARLAEIRLSRNITQESLASETETSVSSIKRLEAGRNLSLDTLLRVLTFYGYGNLLLESLPNPGVRPVERLKQKGKERRRASGGEKHSEINGMGLGTGDK